MVEIIPSDTRGGADYDKLKTRYTFSFADYHNPQRVRFGPLRVINEDRIAPAGGFPTHPHRDMEILTYPISGAIEHKDTMGNSTVVAAGEVQRMTAGTGIQHSEYNHSQQEPLHLLQIWIIPEQQNLEPGYEQKTFTHQHKLNQLRLIASRDGRDGSITVHQKVDMYAGILQQGLQLEYMTAETHKVFVQVVHGEISVNDHALRSGDGVQIRNETSLSISADTEAELLLFDMS